MAVITVQRVPAQGTDEVHLESPVTSTDRGLRALIARAEVISTRSIVITFVLWAALLALLGVVMG